MGQLTSPLLCQELEASANPFGVSGFRQQAAASRSKCGKSLARHRFKEFRETCARCVEPFPSVEKSLSKGKRDRDFESVQLSLKEKGKIPSERRSLHEYFDKKAECVFQGEFAAQTRLSEVQTEIDRKGWQRRNADIALYETNRQHEFLRVELYQANQLTHQAQREKSWLFGEVDLRKRVFQEDLEKDCKEIEELRRTCNE